MSRKRLAKKRQKLRRGAVEELAALYRRGADEEFLAAVGAVLKEDPEAVDGELAARRDAVAERLLAAALRSGDPDRPGALLRRVGRAPDTPLTRLAEAVAHLAAGRCAAAAARLDSLPAPLPLPPPAPAVAAGARALVDLGRELAAAGDGRPGDELADDPALSAAQRFFRALAALSGRGFRPGGRPLGRLLAATQELRRTLAEEPGAARLATAVSERVDLLRALRDVEARLRRPRPSADGGAAPADDPVARLRPRGGLPLELLASAPPALLAPLHHALRVRWRSVLELAFAYRGPALLLDLEGAWPAAVAAGGVAIGGGTGAGAGRANRIATRTNVERMVRVGEYDRLARLLAAESRGSVAATRLAELWACEVWAQDRALDRLWEEGAAEEAEDACIRAVRRLGEMASAIADLVPPAQRLGVAHFLRDALLELYLVAPFEAPCAAVAETLLEHLSGDASLLALALAAAVAARRERDRRQLAEAIARRGAAPEEAEVLLTVVAEAAHGEVDDLLATVDDLAPLFDASGWQLARERAAETAARQFAEELEEVFHLPSAALAAAGAAIQFDVVRLKLAFGEHEALAVIELVAGACEATSRQVARRARAHLEAWPSLASALRLFEVITPAPRDTASAGLRRLVDASAAAVVDRLDDGWERWGFYVAPLAALSSAPVLRKLRRRLESLLQDAEAEDQGLLERLLLLIRQFEEVRGFEKPTLLPYAVFAELFGDPHRNLERRSGSGGQLDLPGLDLSGFDGPGPGPEAGR